MLTTSMEFTIRSWTFPLESTTTMMESSWNNEYGKMEKFVPCTSKGMKSHVISFPSVMVEFEEDEEKGNEDEDMLCTSMNTMDMTRQVVTALCTEEAEREYEMETYETLWPKQLDKTFYRFEKEIRHEPWQVIRYEWEGNPLLASHLSHVDEFGGEVSFPFPIVVPCTHCGSKRVFECQLMPAILSVLPVGQSDFLRHIPRSNREPSSMYATLEMDWSTILIYSCSADCGLRAKDVHEKNMFIPSFVVIQP